MKQLAIDALRHRYEAQKKSAKYILTNYLQNPTAIGEHPDLLAEMDKALESWEEASSRLEALDEITDDSYPSLFD
tara:strand:+ start:289 stop:513 length:225 start_codon:yes stop_codon:yes gene_type:complete